MILVDTSVWVFHLRNGLPKLQLLLYDGLVATHPYIIGELACGNLKNRIEILTLLQSLFQVTVAEHDEVMWFIENHQLMGKGLGYIDVHLLAATLLSDAQIWTLDKKLEEAANELRVCF